MINTDFKIVVIPVHRNVKGMPERKQSNQSIDVLVKAKTMKRCMEIYGQIVGYREYKFTNYNREMGHNKSNNTTFMEYAKDYEECVMYCLEWKYPHEYILFDGFDNKLLKEDKTVLFKLDVPESLKDIMENGIHFDRLLKQ